MLEVKFFDENMEHSEVVHATQVVFPSMNVAHIFVKEPEEVIAIDVIQLINIRVCEGV